MQFCAVRHPPSCPDKMIFCGRELASGILKSLTMFSRVVVYLADDMSIMTRDVTLF